MLSCQVLLSATASASSTQVGADPAINAKGKTHFELQRVDKPTTHYTLELTSSFDSRPERSKGGANILTELGLRTAILREQNDSGGWTYGGELSLRSMTPETEGSSTVKSELYRLSTHAAGLFGYRWSTRHAGYMPHLSLGLSNDFVLVRLVSPGNSSLRPRWLPGLFAGAGVMVNFLSFLLRGDLSMGLSDGRPEYRWNLGIGARF